MKPIFEAQVQEPLEMGESDFKAMIIRYEGKEAKFGMHYDTEHPNCYRALILYRGEGIVPPFCYVDQDLVKVHLQPGDGIFFKGTQTYHGVYPSGDDSTVRYMLGFQYKKKGTKEKKSLCSELRNETYWGILYLFLPYFLYYHGLTLLDTLLSRRLKSNRIQHLGYIVALVCVLLSYQCSNQFGTQIVHSVESILRFYVVLLLFTFKPKLSFLLLGYFMITEMMKSKYNPSEFI